MEGPDAIFSKTGIDDDLAPHAKNHTWKIVPRLEAKIIFLTKWVFQVKESLSSDRTLVQKTKAELCARGFHRVEEVGYVERFAPVEKFSSIRDIISLVAWFDLELHKI